MTPEQIKAALIWCDKIEELSQRISATPDFIGSLPTIRKCLSAPEIMEKMAEVLRMYQESNTAYDHGEDIVGMLNFGQATDLTAPTLQAYEEWKK